MDYKIIVLPEAEIDVAEAFEYISEHSSEAAGRWYRKIVSAIDTLRKSPFRCPLAPEAAKLGMELRQLLNEKHPESIASYLGS